MRLRRLLDAARPASPEAAPARSASEADQIAALLTDPVVGPEISALQSPGTRREWLDRHAMPVLLAALLPPDAHTIDVGAHSGAVLREIVRIAPDGHHIAYEPLPELAAGLAEQFPMVEVRNAALSDTTGSASFIHVDSAPEFSGLRERTYHVGEVTKHEIVVRTERLDDALPDDFRPDFIKIDVEGAEMQVLRGAFETLRQYRPAIVFEHGIGAADHYGTTSDAIHDLLVGELDMRIFDLDGEGPYSREEFVAIFAQPIWNFLAIA